MAEQYIAAGSRYDSTNPVLLNYQAPTGVPRSTQLRSVTDPISPTPRTSDRLRHFYEGIYDLSPDSHLSRFLKVLLGDSGIGVLSKRYAVARQQSFLLTTHYSDLDRLYGSTLNYPRLSGEALGISPFTERATPEAWDLIDAKDASYRSRVEAFSRSLLLGQTPDGMAAIAQSILGVEVSIVETYRLIDEAYAPSTPPSTAARTYGDIERQFIYYGSIRGTYGDLESGQATFGRTTNQNRNEFIVRPHRSISLEETYSLIKVLGRLKPADALLTIDSVGSTVNSQVLLRAAYADSTYWEVSVKVAPREEVASAYDVQPEVAGQAVAQPRPPFSGYQGEAWSYNSDVAKTTSYSLNADGTVRDTVNYQRVMMAGRAVDYTPDQALGDHTRILLGRAASDGVLTASPYASERVGTMP